MKPNTSSPALNQYIIDIERFPEIPTEVKDEILYFLKLQISDQPLNSQRNFFVYMMIGGTEEVYSRFLKLWEETDEDMVKLDEISPYC